MHQRLCRHPWEIGYSLCGQPASFWVFWKCQTVGSSPSLLWFKSARWSESDPLSIFAALNDRVNEIKTIIPRSDLKWHSSELKPKITNPFSAVAFGVDRLPLGLLGLHPRKGRRRVKGLK